jgi:four helix bundle protein
MLKQTYSPTGYKQLLVYQKAEQLQMACAAFTSRFPPSSRSKTLLALADQMDRSARSVKQNIVEGWKRNGTKEYFEFLGFSLGACAELEEDCDDIIRGVYKEMGLKGIEEKGGRGGMGGRGDIEKIPFYPLDPRLPPLVQLKLRCKEIHMLLQKLQRALSDKMTGEFGVPLKDRLLESAWRERHNDEWIQREREKWEKREEGEQ